MNFLQSIDWMQILRCFVVGRNNMYSWANFNR